MTASPANNHRGAGARGAISVVPEIPMPANTRRAAGSVLRVVLADDPPVVRIGVRNLLMQHGQFLVISEAQNAAETIEQTLALQPDVLLMDLNMPGASGLDTLRALANAAPKVCLLLLTGSITKEQETEAMRSGARGIVLKSDISGHITEAILATASGGYWFEGRVHEQLPQEANSQTGAQASAGEGETSPDANRFQLTRRELEVVGLIVKGYPNREIAKEFSLSEETVKRHLSNIFDKLGMSTRLELAIFAIAHKLVKTED